MSQIVLDIPQDTLLALHVSLDEAAGTVQIAAAAKLYEVGRLSSGAAAKLAGVPRTVFLQQLADFDVDTFRVTEQQLREETRLA